MVSFNKALNVLVLGFSLSVSGVVAFAPPNAPVFSQRLATDLYAVKNEDAFTRLAGGAAVLLTGIGAAAQIAFASPDIDFANSLTTGE